MTKAKRKSQPPPQAQRIGRLDTVGGVVRELGRLYRGARRGEVSVQDAARLAYILGTIRQSLEAGSFEQRLEAIEAGMDHGEPDEP